MYLQQVLKTKYEGWRYIVTLALVLFSYMILGSIPLAGTLIYKQMSGEPVDIEEFAITKNPVALNIEENTGLLLMLIPSVLAFFTLLILMLKLHGYRFGDVFSAAGRVRWGRFAKGALLWLLLLGLADLTYYLLAPGNYTMQFNLEKFIPLLVIALVMIPFQAWSEELMFRSYLLQGIGLLFGSRILALLITSVAFGLLHSANPEVSRFGFWNIMPYYIGFGLFAGLLVFFDDGIELAFAVHAVNNIYSAVIVGYESSVLNTSSIWKISELKPAYTVIAFYACALLFFFISSRIFRYELSFKKVFLNS